MGHFYLQVDGVSRRFEQLIQIVQDLLLVGRKLGPLSNNRNVNVAQAVAFALHQPYRFQQEHI